MGDPLPRPILQAISQEQAFWWRDQRALLVLTEDEERPYRTLMIRLIACQKEDLVEILQDYRILAGKLQIDQAGWIAPLHPDIEPLIQQAGFQRDWDSSLFIYERRHPNS
jgi:hypothetical protein